MTKIQSLISEIHELDPNELELVLKEVLKRLDKTRRVQAILQKYQGLGKGVWNTDAQDYINQLRTNDRI